MEKAPRWAHRLVRTAKGILSVVVYAIAIPLACVRPWIACAGYILVAIMWVIPDPRIERSSGHPSRLPSSSL